jgi:hypothetical protein
MLGFAHFRALLLGLAAVLLAGRAAAVSFPLDVEFDDGLVGNFGTVTVTENGGDLDFTISLTATLGSGADLHELYFNLVGSFTGLSIIDSNAPNTAYALDLDPPVMGGAGSSFDVGVNFGNGAGAPGNGVLKTATFTLSADQALTLADLDETSSTSQGITVHMAVHVQGTSLVGSTSDSETLGGTIPEPATAFLVAAGLTLTALARRLRRS